MPVTKYASLVSMKQENSAYNMQHLVLKSLTLTEDLSPNILLDDTVSPHPSICMYSKLRTQMGALFYILLIILQKAAD